MLLIQGILTVGLVIYFGGTPGLSQYPCGQCICFTGIVNCQGFEVNEYPDLPPTFTNTTRAIYIMGTFISKLPSTPKEDYAILNQANVFDNLYISCDQVSHNELSS
jgi:hypothetical protein